MIYLFLAEGHEEIEALTVVDMVRRAGLDIETVSITDANDVTGSHKITTIADRVMADIDWNDADMLVLPGGMPGTLNLGACDNLMSHVDAFAESGKMIAAICAAPTLFGQRGLLKGKRACCYPGMEDKLIGAEVTYDKVAVDGNIITSRGMGTAIDFSLAIIEHFAGREAADKLAGAIVYK